jgi:hypothetical protein
VYSYAMTQLEPVPRAWKRKTLLFEGIPGDSAWPKNR